MEPKSTAINLAQMIIDAMQDMVRIVDCNGKVIAENVAMKQQMGQLIGNPCFRIWGTGKECEHCLAQQVYRKQTPAKAQRKLNDQYFSVSAAPFYDDKGELQGIVEVFNDITKHITLQKKLIRANGKMLRDIEMGRRMQDSIVRKRLPQPEGYRFTSGFFPCEAIGGDMFDCFSLRDGRILMYVADVSGHGIMSAMLTVFIKQQIVSWAEQNICSPAKILEKIFHQFHTLDAEESIYITVFLAVLDPKTGTIIYSNAGHSVMPWLFKGNQVEEIFLPGTPICRWTEESDYREEQILLRPGDRILLYTDGIPGIHTRQDVKDNLITQFGKIDFAPKEFIGTLCKDIADEKEDDLTLLICEFLPK